MRTVSDSPTPRYHALVQLLGGLHGGGSIVRQQRRNLQRHPAIYAVGPVENRPEEARGLCEIVNRQVEEQFLGPSTGVLRRLYVGVIGGAVFDRVVENGRVGGKPRHGKLADIARQRAGGHQIAGDVIQPKALS